MEGDSEDCAQQGWVGREGEGGWEVEDGLINFVLFLGFGCICSCSKVRQKEAEYKGVYMHRKE